MGLDTECCTVPFALEDANDIVAPLRDEFDNLPVRGHLNKNGWLVMFEVAHEFKNKKKILLTNFATKDGMEVYILDQYPYPDGDCNDWAIFSKKKEDLEAFLIDFKKRAKIRSIDENVTLQQSL